MDKFDYLYKEFEDIESLKEDLKRLEHKWFPNSKSLQLVLFLKILIKKREELVEALK